MWSKITEEMSVLGLGVSSNRWMYLVPGKGLAITP